MRQIYYEQDYFEKFGQEIQTLLKTEHDTIPLDKGLSDEDAARRYYEIEYTRTTKALGLVSQMKLNNEGYIDINMDANDHDDEVYFLKHYLRSGIDEREIDFNNLKIILRHMVSDNTNEQDFTSAAPLLVAFCLDKITRARFSQKNHKDNSTDWEAKKIIR